MSRHAAVVLLAGCLASPAALAVEPREYFKTCSASYDQVKPTLEAWQVSAGKAVAEAKGQPFYPAYLKLANAYTALVQEGLKTKDDVMLRYSSAAGPAATLLLAIAELQTRTGYAYGMPVALDDTKYAWAIELTGDDAFDRNVFCSLKSNRRPNDAPWLDAKDFKAHSDKATELMNRTLGVYNALRERVVANTRPRLGDVVRVKSVKKNSDGTWRLDTRRIDGSYVCVHTGKWRWTGTEWSDCDYQATPAKETDRIAVTFKELPMELKGGDELMIVGNVPAGVEVNQMSGRPIGKKAAYEGLYVAQVARKKDGVVMRLSLDRPLHDFATGR